MAYPEHIMAYRAEETICHDMFFFFMTLSKEIEKEDSTLVVGQSKHDQSTQNDAWIVNWTACVDGVKSWSRITNHH